MYKETSCPRKEVLHITCSTLGNVVGRTDRIHYVVLLGIFRQCRNTACKRLGARFPDGLGRGIVAFRAHSCVHVFPSVLVILSLTPNMFFFIYSLLPSVFFSDNCSYSLGLWLALSSVMQRYYLAQMPLTYINYTGSHNVLP